MNKKSPFKVVQPDEQMRLATVEDFFFIIEQIVVDEGLLEFVANEGLYHLYKEGRIVSVEEEVEFMGDFFIIDL